MIIEFDEDGKIIITGDWMVGHPFSGHGTLKGTVKNCKNCLHTDCSDEGEICEYCIEEGIPEYWEPMR